MRRAGGQGGSVNRKEFDDAHAGAISRCLSAATDGARLLALPLRHRVPRTAGAVPDVRDRRGLGRAAAPWLGGTRRGAQVVFEGWGERGTEAGKLGAGSGGQYASVQLQEQFSILGKPRGRGVDKPSVRVETIAGGEDGFEGLTQEVWMLGRSRRRHVRQVRDDQVDRSRHLVE